MEVDILRLLNLLHKHIIVPLAKLEQQILGKIKSNQHDMPVAVALSRAPTVEAESAAEPASAEHGSQQSR